MVRLLNQYQGRPLMSWVKHLTVQPHTSLLHSDPWKPTYKPTACVRLPHSVTSKRSTTRLHSFHFETKPISENLLTIRCTSKRHICTSGRCHTNHKTDADSRRISNNSSTDTMVSNKHDADQANASGDRPVVQDHETDEDSGKTADNFSTDMAESNEHDSPAVQDRLKALDSPAFKHAYSLEKYYKEDDVSTEAILIYSNQHLARYKLLYTLTATLYASDILAFYAFMPPVDVSLVKYTFDHLGSNGLLHDPFIMSLFCLPVCMHMWTYALKQVRRQLRAIYFQPSLQKYIGISYTWRWKTRRTVFDQSEVMLEKAKSHDTPFPKSVKVQDHPYILHQDCFTSELYRERFYQIKHA